MLYASALSTALEGVNSPPYVFIAIWTLFISVMDCGRGLKNH